MCSWSGARPRWAIGSAVVAAVLHSQPDLVTHRRALLVDRAADAVLVDGDAPAFLVARHDLQPVRGAGGQVARDAILGHQYHRQAAADRIAVSARHGGV